MFASEEKALLAHPQVVSAIDDTGIAELFAMVPMTNPNSSIFRGVVQVQPGHTATFTPRGIRTQCYWKLEAQAHTDDESTTVNTLTELFEQAVHSQMVSDVPLGSMLSGGVDSSSIASFAAGIAAQEGKQLPTFAIDYTSNRVSYEASLLHVDRDTPWAEKVATHIKSLHSTHYLSVADLLEAQADTLHAWGRPSYSPVNVSPFLLFKHIRLLS